MKESAIHDVQIVSDNLSHINEISSSYRAIINQPDSQDELPGIRNSLQRLADNYFGEEGEIQTHRFQSWRFNDSVDIRRRSAERLYLGAAADLQAGSLFCAWEQFLRDPQYTQYADQLDMAQNGIAAFIRTDDVEPKKQSESLELVVMVEETLALLVQQNEEALLALIKKSGKEFQRLMEASQQSFSGLFDNLRNSELFQRGLKLIKRGLETLKELLKGIDLSNFLDPLKDLMEQNSKHWLTQGLERLFEAKQTIEFSRQLAPSYSANALLNVGHELKKLSASHQDKMNKAKSLMNCVTLIFMMPLLGFGSANPSLVVIYGLISIGTLVISADHADAGVRIDLVRGIRTIIREAPYNE